MSREVSVDVNVEEQQAVNGLGVVMSFRDRGRAPKRGIWCLQHAKTAVKQQARLN
jgi:hypothetical protein